MALRLALAVFGLLLVSSCSSSKPSNAPRSQTPGSVTTLGQSSITASGNPSTPARPYVSLSFTATDPTGAAPTDADLKQAVALFEDMSSIITGAHVSVTGADEITVTAPGADPHVLDLIAAPEDWIIRPVVAPDRTNRNDGSTAAQSATRVATALWPMTFSDPENLNQPLGEPGDPTVRSWRSQAGTEVQHGTVNCTEIVQPPNYYRPSLPMLACGTQAGTAVPQPFLLDPSVVDGTDFIRARVVTHSTGSELQLTIDPKSATRLADYTPGDHEGRLALTVNDVVVGVVDNSDFVAGAKAPLTFELATRAATAASASISIRVLIDSFVPGPVTVNG